MPVYFFITVIAYAKYETIILLHDIFLSGYRSSPGRTPGTYIIIKIIRNYSWLPWLCICYILDKYNFRYKWKILMPIHCFGIKFTIIYTKTAEKVRPHYIFLLRQHCYRSSIFFIFYTDTAYTYGLFFWKY